MPLWEYRVSVCVSFIYKILKHFKMAFIVFYLFLFDAERY